MSTGLTSKKGCGIFAVSSLESYIPDTLLPVIRTILVPAPIY
jgi:hypothetical protein